MIGITSLRIDHSQAGGGHVVNILVEVVALPTDINGTHQEIVPRIQAALEAAFAPGPPPVAEDVYREIHGRKITL